MNSGIFAIFIFLAESGFIKNPADTSIEPTLINFVSWFELTVEMTGALILAIGVAVAVYEFVLVLFNWSEKNYNRVRLSFARYLVLALEFQLAADILATAVAPSWEKIGKLAAIAVIRTGLNYFLSIEMKHERKLTGDENKIEENEE